MSIVYVCIHNDVFLLVISISMKSNWLILLQVILHSEVKATLTIHDAWLDLQDGFVHAGRGDGRPTSGFFPLIISPSSRAGILFSICLGKTDVQGIDNYGLIRANV